MASTTTKAVILDNPSDWEPWLFVVKTIADGGDTWKYIDPSIEPEPVVPGRPEIPTPKDVNPAKTTILELNAAEKETFKLLMTIYKEDLAIAKQILDTIQTVRNHVATTVSTDNIVYINDKTTVHQMLVALKKRLAPTDYARKLDLARKYNKLKKYTKRDDIEKWLKDWETTFTDGKKLKIPEVADDRSLLDFTHAISSIDSGYASTQEYFINQKLKNKDNLPELYDLVEDFRNHYRRTEALKSSSSHSAFAALHGESQDGGKLCLCGDKHGKRFQWEKCEYISLTKRPAGWKGKPEIFEKINKAINSWESDKIKWFVDKFKYDGLKDSKKDATKDGDSNKLGSFITYSSFTSSDDYKLYNSWTLDNASDIHVCNDVNRSGFRQTREATPDDELFAGKTSYPIEAFGTVTVYVQTPNGRCEIELTNVALAPGFMTNLVSLQLLNCKGVHWSSEHPDKITRSGKILCNLEQIDHHWVFERNTGHSSFTDRKSFAVRKSEARRHATFTGAQMHRVLGHASPEVIEHVSGDDITIVNTTPSPSTIDCETCSLSKATEIVSRRTEVEDSENGIPFDRTTWDMIELNRGFNGDRYVSHFQCRQYLFNLVYTHPKKSDAQQSFDKAISTIEGQYNGKVRYVRLDGETSLGNAFETLVTEKGIKAERTAPDTPAQNGGSERSGRVLITKARTMRIEASLPTNLWPEIVKAAGYIGNRTPVRKLAWMTSFEAVKKEKPRFAHMHVYGCRAYPLNHHIPRKDKLDPRAHIGYLVGYDSTNIYRIWMPSRGKVIRTRDVTLKDDLFYDPLDLDIGAVLKEHVDKIIETLELPEMQVTELADDDNLLDTLTDTNHPEASANHPEASVNHPKASVNHSQALIDSLLVPTSLPAAPGNQARRGNEISGEFDLENIIQGSRTRRSAHATALKQTDELIGYFSAFSTARMAITTKPPHRDKLPLPPKSWKQMLKHQYSNEFKRAADKEFNALLSKGTFNYVAKSQVDDGTTPLPLMWVFTYKFDQDGYLLKHKARLVARGDLQYIVEDTYAATLAVQTFRAVMAIVAAFDLETRQYDAVNAFANATLPKPITCQCAEGYEQLNYLLLVQQALYGLKISPLLWFKDLTLALEELGLNSVPETNCLFVNDWLILIFYVDDILTAYSSKHQDRMDEFELRLMKKYEIRSLGEATHFLGIRIVRDRPQRKLWLVQDSYIDKMAEKFNITANNVPKTPLPSTELVPYEGTATAQQIYGYQQRVGSINFPAVVTRPDISKAVSKLSEFLQNPSPQHIAAADRTIEYLVGTKYWAIEYDGNLLSDRKIFITSSDSAFADDPLTRNSSYGFCFSLFGGVIHYKAVKGTTVTTSSTEAELLALSLTAKEFIRWKRFFQQIQFDLEQEPTICCDNLQTIRLLTKETPKLQTALKHVDIHQSWLRQEVQAKRIKVEWVPTADMVADGFTKVLPAQKHAEFVRQLNLVDIEGKF
jgi:Reverse transcriptase (RNA-dependent DNA polymerase)/Pol polyprotein, beta-barrel domain